jgi:hypothetical protein
MSDRRWLLAGTVLLCLFALALVGRDLDQPGLYYDEVIQAVPAAEFLAADGRPSELPGVESTRLFGGWFPTMTQPYMGALKSQLLIPSLALFGNSAALLRGTTLLWGLVGLALAMLFARQVLGLQAALVAGALLAVDPSFLFIARHDWGSFSLGLVMRCAGLCFAVAGFRRREAWRLLAAGLCFGLGVYNKIDFAIFIAAATLALLISAPGTLRTVARERPGAALLGLLGFALGAAPMLATLPGLARRAGAMADRQGLDSDDWSEKLDTFTSTLDGSYFDRLMQAGGSFEGMAAVEGGTSGPFLLLFALASVALAVQVVIARRSDAAWRGQAFVLSAALLTGVMIFVTPRAVRIHHALLLYPFPHLVVAAAAVGLWNLHPSRISARVAAGLAVAVALAGGIALDLKTLATIHESGGRGRWSGALAELAQELRGDPGAVVVTLDWGFHQPLRFLNRDLPVIETIWELRGSGGGRPWSLDGGPEHVYLLPLPSLAVFDSGDSFLSAVGQLQTDDVEARTHRDGRGEPAFISVRIARPHRLVYRDRFEVIPR